MATARKFCKAKGGIALMTAKELRPYLRSYRPFEVVHKGPASRWSGAGCDRGSGDQRFGPGMVDDGVSWAGKLTYPIGAARYQASTAALHGWRFLSTSIANPYILSCGVAPI